MIYKTEYKVPENVNDWLREQIKYAEMVLSDVTPLHPCRLLYILNDEEKLERVTVELITDSPLLFTVKYDTYRAEYKIEPLLFFDFGNLYSMSRDEVKDALERPNRIRKINRRKIDEWMKYHTERHRAYMNAKREKESFQKATRDRINALKSQGVEVRWTNTEDTKGYLERNGIELIFSIESNHLYGELRFSALANLENFITLSDNKYKGER